HDAAGRGGQGGSAGGGGHQPDGRLPAGGGQRRRGRRLHPGPGGGEGFRLPVVDAEPAGVGHADRERQGAAGVADGVTGREADRRRRAAAPPDGEPAGGGAAGGVVDGRGDGADPGGRRRELQRRPSAGGGDGVAGPADAGGVAEAVHGTVAAGEPVAPVRSAAGDAGDDRGHRRDARLRDGVA